MKNYIIYRYIYIYTSLGLRATPECANAIIPFKLSRIIGRAASIHTRKLTRWLFTARAHSSREDEFKKRKKNDEQGEKKKKKKKMKAALTK